MTRTIRWLSAALFSFAVLVPGQLCAQTCGGTQRWQVKVGTDTGVGSVDLTAQVPISVQDLIHLNEPQRPATGDNDTRLPEETHVYVVRGHLVKFKLETGSTGDQDYHMVISDDSLSFTDDHAGMPPGHSVVAEIPNPDCIPGKHGDPSVPSRFIDSIRSARNELETQFSNIDHSGAFNDAGGIPVQIIGVGFFDFPHHQVGRASNNIELHPVLDITFNPTSGSFSLSAAPAQLSVPQGGTVTSTVSTTISGGLNSAISLSAAGAPSNTNVTFSSSSIAAPGAGSSTFSLAVGSSTPPGAYNLTVTASGGGVTQSATITLTVTAGDTIPPTTSITVPADGTSVSGVVNINATAMDNVGVVKTEIYVDGALKACNFGTNSIAYPWDTSTVSIGSHTILSKAYDAAGNVGTSATVTVTVAN